MSVVIPAYNRPQVREAVESVLNQTYENLEVVVVDDHSETPAKEHLDDIEDERLKILRHEENKNGAAARNTGIENSTGGYIALLDDDDVWKPEKLEKQFEKLDQKGDGFEACYTWAEISGENGNSIMKSSQEGDIRKEILLMQVSGSFGSTLLVKKEHVKEVGGFDESFPMHQDWEFLIRILRNTKICVVKEPLITRDGDDYGFSVDPGRQAVVKRKYLEKFNEEISQYNLITRRRIPAVHYSKVSQGNAFNGRIKDSMRFFYLSVSKWPFQNPKDLVRPFYYILKSRMSNN